MDRTLSQRSSSSVGFTTKEWKAVTSHHARAIALVLGGLVLAVLLLTRFVPNIHDASTTRSGASRPNPDTPSNTGTGQVSPAKQATTEDKENDELEAASDAHREREIREIQTQHQRQYSTAIVFYGVVLDLTEQPVPALKSNT